MDSPHDQILRKVQLAGLLELLCEALDLTPSQREMAEARYKAVGEWLSASEEQILRSVNIYAQGSFAIRTVVRPLWKNEFDLDLVCFVLGFPSTLPPSLLKRIIGERLRMHETYKHMLEEKPRCWRLTYANEFYLDITPAVANSTCQFGGELVPDKSVNEWKPSNPKGYRNWFENRAKILPRMRLLEAPLAKLREQVELLPGPTAFKGVLSRIVQLCKRHRDIHFMNDPKHAPISIILTTLVAKSYALCATNFTYDTEFDLLVDVVRHAGDFIETRSVGGSIQYYIWNETTVGENFAEKWNKDVRLAQAFFSWQKQTVSDLEKLAEAFGLDRISNALSTSFGESAASKAMAAYTDSISGIRSNGGLAVSPGVGLGIYAPNSVNVRPNTFFGS